MIKPDLKSLLPSVEKIARQAGAEIMTHYAGTTIYAKDDGSNVTDADYAAEKIILPALKQLTPEIPIISEERVASGDIPDFSKGTFWAVDPLDGTHEFISKTGAFVVAIALIIDNKAALGVVYHPAMDVLYSGIGPGTASRLNSDGTRTPLPLTGLLASKTMRILVNKRNADMPRIEKYLERFDRPLEIDTQSGIMRVCQVAEGRADMSVVCMNRPGGRIAFWDVAPGHAIIDSAGGRIETLQGQPLRYDAADLHVTPHIVISAHQVENF